MYSNIFEAIKDKGEAGGDIFEPRDDETFEPTHFLPGTREKYQLICWRIENGYPLWHPLDPVVEIEPQAEARKRLSRMQPVLEEQTGGQDPYFV